MLVQRVSVECSLYAFAVPLFDQLRNECKTRDVERGVEEVCGTGRTRKRYHKLERNRRGWKEKEESKNMRDAKERNANE